MSRKHPDFFTLKLTIYDKYIPERLTNNLHIDQLLDDCPLNRQIILLHPKIGVAQSMANTAKYTQTQFRVINNKCTQLGFIKRK